MASVHNYFEWLWKILVVTDESEPTEEYANAIVSLLGTLKDPPDVELRSIYAKMPEEKCRKALFILDESNRTTTENKAVCKWLRGLEIDPLKSEKYLVLLLDQEGVQEPLGFLAEKQVIHVHMKEAADVYVWWPRVIRFLCKTRNWDNSAYILLHAGFGHDLHDSRKMAEHVEKLEGQKKLIEVMLGQFGPRHLHKEEWNGGLGANRPVSATDVELARVGKVFPNSKHSKAITVPTGATKPPDGTRHIKRKWLFESFVAKYLSEDPLKPSWTDLKGFASVVPVFILMNSDITVAEKCCLTDYAREFPKTHFLCVSEDPPSEYIKLVSRNVFWTKDLMTFIFQLLRELKIISSIKSKKKDSCVCAIL